MQLQDVMLLLAGSGMRSESVADDTGSTKAGFDRALASAASRRSGRTPEPDALPGAAAALGVVTRPIEGPAPASSPEEPQLDDSWLTPRPTLGAGEEEGQMPSARVSETETGTGPGPPASAPGPPPGRSVVALRIDPPRTAPDPVPAPDPAGIGLGGLEAQLAERGLDGVLRDVTVLRMSWVPSQAVPELSAEQVAAVDLASVESATAGLAADGARVPFPGSFTPERIADREAGSSADLPAGPRQTAGTAADRPQVADPVRAGPIDPMPRDAALRSAVGSSTDAPAAPGVDKAGSAQHIVGTPEAARDPAGRSPLPAAGIVGQDRGDSEPAVEGPRQAPVGAREPSMAAAASRSAVLVGESGGADPVHRGGVAVAAAPAVEDGVPTGSPSRVGGSGVSEHGEQILPATDQTGTDPRQRLSTRPLAQTSLEPVSGSTEPSGEAAVPTSAEPAGSRSPDQRSGTPDRPASESEVRQPAAGEVGSDVVDTAVASAKSPAGTPGPQEADAQMAASAAPLRTSAKSDIGPARIEPDAAPIGQTAADSAGAVLNPSAAQPDRPDTAPQQGTALARSVGQQVTERVRTLAAESGGGTATLELRPPELGRLWLSVRVDGSSVAVRAVASSPVAGEMLQAGASALRESLGKAGMHFASLHVSVDSGAGGTFAGHAGQTAGHEQSTAHSAYRALTPAYGDLQSGSPDAARDDPGIRLAWRRAGGMSQMLDAVA